MTSDAETSNPAAMPDGRAIVFEREGGLRRSDLDGQNARAIPNTNGASRPTVMAEGKSVLYTATARRGRDQAKRFILS